MFLSLSALQQRDINDVASDTASSMFASVIPNSCTVFPFISTFSTVAFPMP